MTPPANLRGIWRLKAAVDALLGGLLALVMGVLVVNVLWQVFTRFILKSPSPFTDELARYLLIWVGLLGAAYVAGQRLHLAIDLLPNRLTGRAGQALGAVIEGVIALFAIAVMVVGGVRLVGLTLLLGQTSAALQLPLWVVYTVLPISGALIAFYALIFLVDHVQKFRYGVPEEEVTPGPVNRALGTADPHTLGGV